MAKVLGFNPTEHKTYREAVEKAEQLERLVKELVQLNQAQDEEIRRIIGEYDSLYEKYDSIKKKIKTGNNIPGIEFIDFTKPNTNE